jgi:hypothetical protein
MQKIFRFFVGLFRRAPLPPPTEAGNIRYCRAQVCLFLLFSSVSLIAMIRNFGSESMSVYAYCFFFFSAFLLAHLPGARFHWYKKARSRSARPPAGTGEDDV